MSDESWKDEGDSGKPHEELTWEGELRHLRRQEPFVPFVLITTSGDRYEVTNPEMVAVGKNLVFYAPLTAGSTYIRTNQMVAVEVAEAAK